MAKSNPIPVSESFTSLQQCLRCLEQRYNPNNKNLHFDALPHSDADLFPAIVSLAEKVWEVVRRYRTFFSEQALLDHRMFSFWYDLFLFISAAARRINIDHAQVLVPTELIDTLIPILARMTHYSIVIGGDLTIRNHEALGDTLLAFYDNKRIRALNKKEPMNIDWTLNRVAEVRAQNKQESFRWGPPSWYPPPQVS